MRTLVIALVILVSSALFAAETTTPLPLEPGAHPGAQAPAWSPEPQQTPAAPATFPDHEEWYVETEYPLDVLLHAGGYLGLQWTANTASIVQSADELTNAAQQAIARAPQWLRADLANKLCQMNTNDQNTWANVILDAQHPYIDEVAFCVANTSVEYLASDYAFPWLFAENAELMYATDSVLDYVEIVDTGAYPDDDYWSTTAYQRLDENGQAETVTVPRDIYYWYIVQPKITDEIPSYVDPDVLEHNTDHYNNIAPDGEFWRDWFWNSADADYPILGEQFDGVEYMWSRTGNDGTAIQVVQQWVNDSMEFTSNAERPHQPVRIYRKHIGRCGEHADITSAAARVALIPCTSVLSVSTDHTWNEFWESEWIQWEPVNNSINDPLCYENGWGKVFGTVFEIRPDGWLTSVTDRYSEATGILTVHCQDNSARPIDGARIVLAVMDGGALRSDMVGYTDSNGDCVFLVGDARDYYMRVSTPLGNYPAVDDDYALLVEDMPDGGEYAFLAPIDGEVYWPDYNPVEPPQDTTDDVRFAVEFEATEQIISGLVTWDDIANAGDRPLFYKRAGAGGTVNLFCGAIDALMFYQLPWTFDSFHTQFQAVSGAATFDVPTTSSWAAWLGNGCMLANAQHITGSLQVWRWGVGVSDEEAPEVASRLLGVCPNPFNPSATVSFSLATPGPVRLEAFNVRGQRVDVLAQGEFAAGTHELTWEPQEAASGVYLLRLTTREGVSTGRAVLLK